MVKKKGDQHCAKKSARQATEGLISVAIKDSSGVIVEINSETDFVARNENFQKFCFDISNLCLNKNLKDKDSLMKTEFSDSGITVEDELTNVISKLGENIVIKKLHHESHDGLFFRGICTMLFLRMLERLVYFYLLKQIISTKVLIYFQNNCVCILLPLIQFL